MRESLENDTPETKSNASVKKEGSIHNTAENSALSMSGVGASNLTSRRPSVTRRREILVGLLKQKQRIDTGKWEDEGRACRLHTHEAW